MVITITPEQAVKRMRELTEVGLPFSFTYCSLNKTKGTTQGFKIVTRALLRQSLRKDQSKLSQQLVAYTDLDDSSKPRQFHLPLLLSFNEFKVKP